MNGMDSRDQGVTAVSEPVRHQVHHSYIWLGTLRVVLAVFVVAVVSMLSSIIGAISEGMHGGGAEVGGVLIGGLMVFDPVRQLPAVGRTNHGCGVIWGQTGDGRCAGSA